MSRWRTAFEYGLFCLITIALLGCDQADQLKDQFLTQAEKIAAEHLKTPRSSNANRIPTWTSTRSTAQHLWQTHFPSILEPGSWTTCPKWANHSYREL